ncbi:transglycosylase family protein [Pseudonocardia lacus]|uniref:LysM peptidoglycan-binding domain-containing protein n=1 Tax=Pseudonocardia lacus TaxID=2835865 RepID=UPI001BDC5359|nr:transglycosylase family protein [Pseudonocardia lacus]
MARYRGRHRKPSNTGRVVARTALAGAVVGTPLLVAPAANAASDSTWDRLADCESSGNWSINSGNGYHGGLQFSPRTWNAFGGQEFAPRAYEASREEQIVVAERVLAEQGWKAWPACSSKLGIRGEPATDRGAPAPQTEVRVRASAPTSGDYVVQRGDTLSTIAQRNGVAGGWQELVQKNPGLAANPNRLSIGQHITL